VWNCSLCTYLASGPRAYCYSLLKSSMNVSRSDRFIDVNELFIQKLLDQGLCPSEIARLERRFSNAMRSFDLRRCKAISGTAMQGTVGGVETSRNLSKKLLHSAQSRSVPSLKETEVLSFRFQGYLSSSLLSVAATSDVAS
jgi:hypothetical protein